MHILLIRKVSAFREFNWYIKIPKTACTSVCAMSFHVKNNLKKGCVRLQKLSFTSSIYCYQYPEMLSHRINSMEKCYLSKQFISSAQINIYKVNNLRLVVQSNQRTTKQLSLPSHNQPELFRGVAEGV